MIGVPSDGSVLGGRLTSQERYEDADWQLLLHGCGRAPTAVQLAEERGGNALMRTGWLK
jgi:hypothetical protein